MTITLDQDVLTYDRNLNEFITIEDYAALCELPIGTRFLDADGDEQRIVRFSDQRVYTEWQLHRSGGPTSLDYDEPEALEQILPAVVLNPEILGEFAVEHPFKVGDRVRLAESRLGGIYGFPRGSALGDEGAVTKVFTVRNGILRARVAVDMDNGITWDDLYAARFELVPTPEPVAFNVGDRVELIDIDMGTVNSETSGTIPFGSVGTVIEFETDDDWDSDEYLNVSFDNGQVAIGWWASRYVHSDVPAPIKPRLVEAESLPVVLDVEALHSLRNGSVIGTIWPADSDQSPYILTKAGGKFWRILPSSVGRTYDRTAMAERDVLADNTLVQVLYSA